MRASFLWAGALAGLALLAGCRLAPTQQVAHKEAVRTNAISNKHTISESPTLERAEPRLPPQP
ncbi:hypothetical protein GO988_07360 [Hymenobacter sp. HMF4947]|uniref:Uncharacterized protein n=1 Tax=Hymenobacter ginkgonis TaxID=2682976 RepID=A0A7K1TCL8_9BACT|nr:hypothetical protein [Hymenobacter ginkgonis]MVN76139.1 hypothetical protein [Hymenobacter ginkgonis]